MSRWCRQILLITRSPGSACVRVWNIASPTHTHQQRKGANTQVFERYTRWTATIQFPMSCLMSLTNEKKKTKNTRHVWIKNKFQLSFRKYTTKELLVNKLLRTSFIRTKGQWNIVSHLSGRCLHRRPYSNKYTAAIDVYCSNGQLVRVRLLDTMKMFILYSRLTLCDFPLPWPDHWVTPTSATINQSTLASIQSCHCHVVPRCAVSRCMPWSTISVSLH